VETDSRLLEGGYGIIQSLIDGDDPNSALGSLRATDAAQPTLDFTITSTGPDELTTSFEATDDVMLISGYGILLYRTDDDEQLAVVGSSVDSIGVDAYAGEGTLPLLGVLVGPEGAEPVSGVVGYLARSAGKYSVPVAVAKGDREERGVLILADDGSVDGLGVLRDDGTWAVLSWDDAKEVPGLEVAPLWFTVDLATGDYETNEGDATLASDVSVSFVELDDTSRLSLVLSVTDVAGNTTIASGALE
jgi:hypothetical protein